MDTPSPTNRFYISTAINYTNGAPHIGHAYEAIAADVLARYQRLRGKEVFFLTGTDEHGQKVAESAEREKLQPIELCDKYVALFKNLNERLNISNNFFIRTTQDKHIKTSQWLWKKAAEKGDIYLGAYEGWYNTREEAFVTEKDAKDTDYKDPGSGKPLIKTKEPSYFFKMSKYQQQLVDHINDNPSFIQPAERRTEILARLKEPLLDLSISRTTFSWGIPVPDSTTEEKHIMYVWFDALTNYLTGVDYPDGELSKFWPCNVHMIGKDISWFHTVIWPCMLFSCDIPLPKTVLCHGFINDAHGQKMSKSLGNVVDPFDLLQEYPADALRYFIIREGVFGSDIAYKKEAFIARHDHELQATLGNLANRGLKFTENHCGGIVPNYEPEPLFNIVELAEKIEDAYSKFQFQTGVELAFEQLRSVNNWLAGKAPWQMKDDKKEEKAQIMRTLLEALYILAHFLYPIIPTAMDRLFKALNHPPKTIPELVKWNNLVSGTTISSGEQLFPRFEPSKWLKKQQGVQPAQPVKQGKGKGAPPAAELVPDAKRLDLRVGKILSCKDHPTKKGHLYVEEIDVGEGQPRQVVSGLAKFIPIDQMENRCIIVICNMKTEKFGGVESQAMVLAANNADDTIVELVEPPQGSKIGERVTIEGFIATGDPTPVALTKTSKKVEFALIKPDLRTNKDKVACYKGIPLLTSAGSCAVKTLSDAQLG